MVQTDTGGQCGRAPLQLYELHCTAVATGCRRGAAEAAGVDHRLPTHLHLQVLMSCPRVEVLSTHKKCGITEEEERR